jgi:hypothetical protein
MPLPKKKKKKTLKKEKEKERLKERQVDEKSLTCSGHLSLSFS